MNNSSAKRPNLLAWAGICVVLLLALAYFTTGYIASHQTRSAGSVSAVAPGYPEQNVDSAMGSGGMAYGTPPPMAPMPSTTAPTGDKSSAADSGTTPTTQRVIKTAELSLRVADAPKTVDDIRSLVDGKNGFVESSSISDSGSGPRSAWLTLRIPATAFDTTLAELKQRAVVVLNESVHGQDVTAEFVDLEADLRNAHAEESSYLEIMKRAGKIEEVLQVAQALAEVRGRIERLDGRQRFLSNQTDLATITVSLTEETRIEAPSRTWQPLEVLRQAVRDAVESLQGLADLLIRAVVGIIGLLVPLALIVGLVLWIGWKIFKSVTKRIK